MNTLAFLIRHDHAGDEHRYIQNDQKCIRHPQYSQAGATVLTDFFEKLHEDVVDDRHVVDIEEEGLKVEELHDLVEEAVQTVA